MKKRFVARKKKKTIKYILLIVVSLISFYYIFNLLVNIKIIYPIIKNENLLDIGLSNKAIKYRTISPRELLYLSTNILFDDEASMTSELKSIDTSDNSDIPLVYIYNTHDSEAYTSHLLEAYNISFTVKTASFILRDYLLDYGIPSYVENESMSNYLNSNNLKYKESYTASRYYFKRRMEEYPSIQLFIDLHRDSARKSVTTTEIDGRKYAKVLFVVGMKHDNYKYNLNIAETLNNMINPALTRGISKKSSSNVNGIYNQDLSKSSILIEVGGQDNTIEEVNNTLKELALLIFKYMKE